MSMRMLNESTTNEAGHAPRELPDKGGARHAGAPDAGASCAAFPADRSDR
jgi:hypothetical protein